MTRVILLLVSALLVTSKHVPTVEEYEEALFKHGKSVGEEYTRPLTRSSREIRQQALEKSALRIEEHNSNPNHSYTMKWNAMSDYTDDEYLSLLQTKPDEYDIPHHRWGQDSHRRRLEETTFLGSIDWSTKNGGMYVTPVKNQGTCGSCWAFTGAAVIETMVAIRSDTDAVPLSVEQLLSCTGSLRHVLSKYPKTMTSSALGCNGGMTFLAYEYLAQSEPHGLACEADMPYRMKLKSDPNDANRCQSIKPSATWDVGSSIYLSLQNDEQEILAALQNGPVGVSIDASSPGFRHYGSGIYDAKDCKSNGKTIDHAVILVGYGETESGEKFWKIRNSWGSMWGERGYMRITRDGISSISGPCNIFLYASQPIDLSGQPQPSCVASIPPAAKHPLSLFAFWPRNLEQGSLIYGVSAALAVLGIFIHFYGEYRLRVNFPKQTYVESFMKNQLPTQSQVLMHMAQRKAKAAVQSV